jgi:hypothetical protein
VHVEPCPGVRFREGGWEVHCNPLACHEPPEDDHLQEWSCELPCAKQHATEVANHHHKDGAINAPAYVAPCAAASGKIGNIKPALDPHAAPFSPTLQTILEGHSESEGNDCKHQQSTQKTLKHSKLDPQAQPFQTRGGQRNSAPTLSQGKGGKQRGGKTPPMPVKSATTTPCRAQPPTRPLTQGRL